MYYTIECSFVLFGENMCKILRAKIAFYDGTHSFFDPQSLAHFDKLKCMHTSFTNYIWNPTYVICIKNSLPNP